MSSEAVVFCLSMSRNSVFNCDCNLDILCFTYAIFTQPKPIIFLWHLFPLVEGFLFKKNPPLRMQTLKIKKGYHLTCKELLLCCRTLIFKRKYSAIEL